MSGFRFRGARVNNWRWAFCAWIGCAAFLLFAGEEEYGGFRLPDYVAPDIRYHALEVEPGVRLGGNMNRDLIRESRDPFSSSLSLSLWHHFLSRTRMRELNITTNTKARIGGSFFPYVEARTESDDDPLDSRISRDARLSYNLSPRLSHQCYLRKHFFLHGTFNPSLQRTVTFLDKSMRRNFIPDSPSSDSGTVYESGSETSHKATTFETTLEFGIGFGYSKDVSAAAAALTILDRLSEVTKAKRAITTGDIQTVGSTLEKLEASRFLDSRQARIDNVTALCSVLVTRNIIDSLPPRAVMEIADQWNYAFRQERLSGWEARVFPRMDVEWRSGDSERKQTDRSSRGIETDIGEPITLDDLKKLQPYQDVHSTESGNLHMDGTMVASFLFERPIQRFFQYSLNTEVAGGYRYVYRGRTKNSTDQDEIQTKEELVNPLINSSLETRWSWYPNTRTTLDLEATILYLRMFDYQLVSVSGFEMEESDRHFDFDNDMRKLTIGFWGNLKYYLSPRISWTGRMNVSRQDSFEYTKSLSKSGSYSNSDIFEISTNKNEGKHWSYSLSTGLTYQFF